MQIADNHALILVEEAHQPSELNASELRDRLREVERNLESAEADSERRRVAERDKLRLERFLVIAEGS
jgi:F0F1-type ATP synthase epsilon subunit